MTKKQEIELTVLPVNAIQPDPDNPNRQDLPVFNALVEGIRGYGFLEPVLVAPLDEEDGTYVLISGEHRWRAAQAAGIDKIPAVVVSGWEEDDRKVHLVRMNALRGKLDPERFTQLWNKLKQRYSEEELRRKLGYGGREAELRRLIKEVRETLPKAQQDDFDKRAERIRSVEDLTAVVQSLFSRYGSTVSHHFILFSFGGKVHLMVRADKQHFEPIRQLAKWCRDNEVQLDTVLAEMASEYLQRKENDHEED